MTIKEITDNILECKRIEAKTNIVMTFGLVSAGLLALTIVCATFIGGCYVENHYRHLRDENPTSGFISRKRHEDR